MFDLLSENMSPKENNFEFILMDSTEMLTVGLQICYVINRLSKNQLGKVKKVENSKADTVFGH